MKSEQKLKPERYTIQFAFLMWNILQYSKYHVL